MCRGLYWISCTSHQGCWSIIGKTMFGFCRMMLCVSAAYAIIQCLSVCLSVCVSVYVSVMFVDHVKTNKYIFKIFSQLGSQAILVFPSQTSWHYSDGNFPNGGVKCEGGMKKWRFSTKISLYFRNDAANTKPTQAVEWYLFEWPWVTSKLDFKVTTLFNVK